jgi:hypothetical protein
MDRRQKSRQSFGPDIRGKKDTKIVDKIRPKIGSIFKHLKRDSIFGRFF